MVRTSNQGEPGGSKATPVELPVLRARAQQAGVSYEIFPVLTYQAPDERVDWFEIVLHAEADAHKPLECPEGWRAIEVLKEVAEFLTRQIAPDRSYGLKLSAWYYTAQPPASGETPATTRLFRSLSLVLFNIPSYRKHDEPQLLTELRIQLQRLAISQRFQPFQVRAGALSTLDLN